MKQNISFSINKDIVKKGKSVAAQNDTSLSQMLSEHLKKITEREERYEPAKRSALQRLKKGFHRGSEVTWKRDQIF